MREKVQPVLHCTRYKKGVNLTIKVIDLLVGCFTQKFSNKHTEKQYM